MTSEDIKHQLIIIFCRKNCTVLKIDRRTQSLGLNSLCTVFLFQPDICIDNLSTHSSVSFQSLHKFKLWRLFFFCRVKNDNKMPPESVDLSSDGVGVTFDTVTGSFRKFKITSNTTRETEWWSRKNKRHCYFATQKKIKKKKKKRRKKAEEYSPSIYGLVWLFWWSPQKRETTARGPSHGKDLRPGHTGRPCP